MMNNQFEKRSKRVLLVVSVKIFFVSLAYVNSSLMIERRSRTIVKLRYQMFYPIYPFCVTVEVIGVRRGIFLLLCDG